MGITTSALQYCGDLGTRKKSTETKLARSGLEISEKAQVPIPVSCHSVRGLTPRGHPVMFTPTQTFQVALVPQAGTEGTEVVGYSPHSPISFQKKTLISVRSRVGTLRNTRNIACRKARAGPSTKSFRAGRVVGRFHQDGFLTSQPALFLSPTPTLVLPLSYSACKFQLLFIHGTQVCDTMAGLTMNRGTGCQGHFLLQTQLSSHLPVRLKRRPRAEKCENNTA